MEENYINYLENIKSIKSLVLACLFYTGVTELLIKRRDVYKNYKKKDLDNLGLGNNNNNNNNESYLQRNINMSNESKKDTFTNKKIIMDDIDEFYYDEEQFEIHSKINKEKNSQNNFIESNAAGYSKRSTRNKDTNIYKEIDSVNVNVSVSNNKATGQKVNFFF